MPIIHASAPRHYWLLSPSPRQIVLREPQPHRRAAPPPLIPPLSGAGEGL
jgi:hypothetical protein